MFSGKYAFNRLESEIDVTDHSPLTFVPRVVFWTIGLLVSADAATFASIFPFVGFIVESFKITDDRNSVGFYAGLLAGAHSMGGFCSGFFWGPIGDRFGRRICAMVGLGSSAVFLILFALSPTYPLAVLCRFLTGLGDPTFPNAKTYVSEVTDSATEARGFSVFTMSWGIGSMLGPTVAGLLAFPATQWPQVFGGTIFDSRPFLLPCLALSIPLVTAMVAVFFFLPEPRFVVADIRRTQRLTAAAAGAPPCVCPPVDLTHPHYPRPETASSTAAPVDAAAGDVCDPPPPPKAVQPTGLLRRPPPAPTAPPAVGVVHLIAGTAAAPPVHRTHGVPTLPTLSPSTAAAGAAGDAVDPALFPFAPTAPPPPAVGTVTLGRVAQPHPYDASDLTAAGLDSSGIATLPRVTTGTMGTMGTIGALGAGGLMGTMDTIGATGAASLLESAVGTFPPTFPTTRPPPTGALAAIGSPGLSPPSAFAADPVHCPSHPGGANRCASEGWARRQTTGGASLGSPVAHSGSGRGGWEAQTAGRARRSRGVTSGGWLDLLTGAPPVDTRGGAMDDCDEVVLLVPPSLGFAAGPAGASGVIVHRGPRAPLSNVVWPTSGPAARPSPNTAAASPNTPVPRAAGPPLGVGAATARPRSPPAPLYPSSAAPGPGSSQSSSCAPSQQGTSAGTGGYAPMTSSPTRGAMDAPTYPRPVQPARLNSKAGVFLQSAWSPSPPPPPTPAWTGGSARDSATARRHGGASEGASAQTAEAPVVLQASAIGPRPAAPPRVDSPPEAPAGAAWGDVDHDDAGGLLLVTRELAGEERALEVIGDVEMGTAGAHGGGGNDAALKQRPRSVVGDYVYLLTCRPVVASVFMYVILGTINTALDEVTGLWMMATPPLGLGSTTQEIGWFYLGMGFLSMLWVLAVPLIKARFAAISTFRVAALLSALTLVYIPHISSFVSDVPYSRGGDVVGLAGRGAAAAAYAAGGPAGLWDLAVLPSAPAAYVGLSVSAFAGTARGYPRLAGKDDRTPVSCGAACPTPPPLPRGTLPASDPRDARALAGGSPPAAHVAAVGDLWTPTPEGAGMDDAHAHLAGALGDSGLVAANESGISAGGTGMVSGRNEMGTAAWVLVAALAVMRVVSYDTAFSMVYILIGNASPDRRLVGTVNALSGSVVAFTRMLTPPIVAMIIALLYHLRLPWPLSYHALFYALAAVTVAGPVVLTCTVRERDYDRARFRALT